MSKSKPSTSEEKDTRSSKRDDSQDRGKSIDDEKEDDRGKSIDKKEDDRGKSIDKKDDDRGKSIGDKKDEDRGKSIDRPSKDRISEDRQARDSSQGDKDRKSSQKPKDDEPKKSASETPDSGKQGKSILVGAKKSGISFDGSRDERSGKDTDDWKRHEGSSDKENGAPDSAKGSRKSRADTYAWTSGKSVSCTDAKRYKVEIEQLGREVLEAFAASNFAVKKTHDDIDAMKMLKKESDELSELFNEIAKSFIAKLHQIEKERARTTLMSASELLLKTGENLRAKFDNADDYTEEIRLNVETVINELKHVEKSLRSSSDFTSNLLKKSMIIALETMMEIAGTPFKKKASGK